MSRMKLAFNTWVYSSYGAVIPSYPLEETIKRIARIGYEGIEIGAGSPHAYPKHTNPQRRRDVKKLLDDVGLKVSTMLPAPGGGPGYNPASPIPEERQDTVEQYKEVAQLCAEWGSKTLIYVPGWQVYGTPHEQAWHWSRQALIEIAKGAADFGVSIVIEPVPCKVVESCDQAIQMMNEVAAPNVKLMFDTIHTLNRREVLTDYVYRMGTDLRHVHLSDTDRLVPGKGRGDFVGLIRSLKEIGYDGYLAMEIGYDKADVEPDRIAREAYEYVKWLLESEDRTGDGVDLR